MFKYAFNHALHVNVEKVFQSTVSNKKLRIKVNGVCISNFRYADDTALLADSLQELRKIFEHIS